MLLKTHKSDSIYLSTSNLTGAPGAFNRDKPQWRASQRKLPIADKVELLGQTILETLELEKIKKRAKSL
jgi:hypothetical protein